VGRGSSVGIATGYGLDGPGIETLWEARYSAPVPNRPLGPPSLLYKGYRVFSGGKERPGHDADPLPLLVPWSRKSRAIPLLPLWAVRSVQSLSVCTRVHFTFTLPYPLILPVFDCKVGQLDNWHWALPYSVTNIVVSLVQCLQSVQREMTKGWRTDVNGTADGGGQFDVQVTVHRDKFL
jgi:hypothetical protein